MADSVLSEVSDLLNEAGALQLQLANDGTLSSDEEIATAHSQIGAFQKTTIDTRLNSIGTQIELTTEFELLLRDTELAFATTNFARLPMLSRVSIKTLTILNANQDNVLNLL